MKILEMESPIVWDHHCRTHPAIDATSPNAFDGAPTDIGVARDSGGSAGGAGFRASGSAGGAASAPRAALPLLGAIPKAARASPAQPLLTFETELAYCCAKQFSSNFFRKDVIASPELEAFPEDLSALTLLNWTDFTERCENALQSLKSDVIEKGKQFVRVVDYLSGESTDDERIQAVDRLLRPRQLTALRAFIASKKGGGDVGAEAAGADAPEPGGADEPEPADEDASELAGEEARGALLTGVGAAAAPSRKRGRPKGTHPSAASKAAVSGRPAKKKKGTKAVKHVAAPPTPTSPPSPDFPFVVGQSITYRKGVGPRRTVIKSKICTLDTVKKLATVKNGKQHVVYDRSIKEWYVRGKGTKLDPANPFGIAGDE